MTALADSPMRHDQRTEELRKRAAAFVEDVLMPLEVTAELAGGPLPPDKAAMVREQGLAYGMHGGMHAVEHGGQGWTATQWYLVEEQFRPQHQRRLLVRARRVQRLEGRHPRADRAVAEARPAR
jgi:hypothetical protein